MFANTLTHSHTHLLLAFWAGRRLQGMDERNERLVFDRIVQSCCGAGKPQYFLVSPKLLQGLRSMEADDVTVLMIWNGPGVQAKWQLSELLKEKRRRSGRPPLEDAPDEAEEDGGGGEEKKSKKKKSSSSSSSSSSR